MPTNDTLQTQLDFLDNLSQINKEKRVVYTLRPYQVEAVEEGVRHLQGNRKPGIIVAPTAAGKSLYIANIAKKLNGHVLILSPSKELLEQNRNKLISYNQGIDVGTYSASFNSREISPITFATIGSIYKKKDIFSHFEFVIIDECHVVNSYETQSMYNQFLTSLGNKRLLGLTASPWRMATSSWGTCLKFLTRTRPRIFHDVIHYTQIKDLLDQGFLATTKYYQCYNGFDSSKIKLNSINSDYDESALRKYYKDVDFSGSVLDVSKRLINAGRKNLLVFTRFVDDARVLAEDLGEIAAIVHGEMPMKERTRILEDFKDPNGKIKVVCNCGVLVLGFDHPELETVLQARPTKSATYYYQTIGRCLRTHYLKSESWVVDIVQNYDRFGKVEDFWLTKSKKDGQWCFINRATGQQITNEYFV